MSSVTQTFEALRRTHFHLLGSGMRTDEYAHNPLPPPPVAESEMVFAVLIPSVSCRSVGISLHVGGLSFYFFVKGIYFSYVPTKYFHTLLMTRYQVVDRPWVIITHWSTVLICTTVLQPPNSSRTWQTQIIVLSPRGHNRKPFQARSSMLANPA